jgi:hypothetical protein
MEKDEFQHGVFTYYLLEALRGEEDLDGNGIITLEEVYHYVSIMDYGLLLSNNPKYQNAGPYFRAFQSHPPIYPSGPEMKDNFSGESFLRWFLAVSSTPPYVVVPVPDQQLTISAILPENI